MGHLLLMGALLAQAARGDAGLAGMEMLLQTGRARLADGLEVAPRPIGGSFRPAGHAHHRELRKWLQERGVLPWRRATLPCLLSGGEMVAVGDLAYGGALAAATGEPSWRVVWHDRPTLTEAEARAVPVRR